MRGLELMTDSTSHINIWSRHGVNLILELIIFIKKMELINLELEI